MSIKRYLNKLQYRKLYQFLETE